MTGGACCYARRWSLRRRKRGAGRIGACTRRIRFFHAECELRGRRGGRWNKILTRGLLGRVGDNAIIVFVANVVVAVIVFVTVTVVEARVSGASIVSVGIIVAFVIAIVILDSRER